MRHPTVLQHDASDCGPAVLAMIAAYYRKRVSLAHLRELCGTDRSGTTLAGLISAAEHIGFAARGVRASGESLPAIALPAIAHTRNHFVVIYEIKPRRMTIGDPAKGLRRVSSEEFHKEWSGILILVKPTLQLRSVINSRSSFSRLLTLLLPHRRLFLDALMAAVLMTILGLASSFFIQALVDFVFILGRTPTLNWLSLGMLLVLFARTGFLGLRAYLHACLSQRIDADTVLGYHRHLLGLPLTFFITRRNGEILSRMNDALKIRVAISATSLSIVVDAILVIVTAGIMFYMNWKLALVSLSSIPILVAVVWLLSINMKRHQRRAIEKAAEVEAHIVETIGAMHVIKAFRAEAHVQLRTESRFLDMLDASFQSQMWAAHSNTLASLIVGTSTLGLLWFGGRQVLANDLTIGQLMALHSMLGMVLGPIERLSSVNQSIQDAMIASERLGEVLELDPEVSRQRANSIDRPLEGSIDFRDVTFRYGSRLPVFENMTFNIKAGAAIGIAGGSGSGKTTLVSLLARFFEPAAGRVLIDGIDVQDYSFDCLRREIVFVPQDIVLLSGSIADNIRFGRPNATPAEIRAAATAANVDYFVERLPNAYDTLVGERGLSLSGGERQRVAIARAILANPSILVLDEPTSHLDAQSELAVQGLIDRRRGVRTTIVISHRPLHVDDIICLGNGNHPTGRDPGLSTGIGATTSHGN